MADIWDELPEIEEEDKKKKPAASPAEDPWAELSPVKEEAQEAAPVPQSREEILAELKQQFVSGQKQLSPEQRDKITKKLESNLKKQEERLPAAGYGVLQGLPFIGTWTDEALDYVGIKDKSEIDRLLRENPEISTTAEILTALAIPIPAPGKVGVLGKMVGAGTEAAATSAGASQEGERLGAAGIGAGIASGLTGTLGALSKGISKGGGLVKEARLTKEAGEAAQETLKQPKRLLGLEDELLIPNKVKEVQQKFNIPTEQIEDVAVRYGVIENPQTLSRAVSESSSHLDEAYDTVDESIGKPVADFLDTYIERFRKDAAVTEGVRTEPIITAAKNKLKKAFADKARAATKKSTRPIDLAVMEDRIIKLEDELLAAKVREKMTPIYKSTLKDFRELADAASSSGSTSIRELVSIKNDLFNEAGNNRAKLALAYDFNNALQGYVEKNAPEHLLAPWKAAKKDWSTLTLIDSHLGKTLSKNYEKAYGVKLGAKAGTSEDLSKDIGAMVRAGYALKNLVQHPLLFGAGMVGKSLIGAPLEKAGDLADKLLQAKKLPSRGFRALEHAVRPREREDPILQKRKNKLQILQDLKKGN